MIEIKKTIDAYTWRVEYHNDVIIPEFDIERPDGRGFAEVNSEQVKTLELWPLLLSPIDQQMIPVHRVSIPEGATPVFFRRRFTIAFQGDDTPGVSVKHCIGWKKDDSACYLFVFVDGSSLMTDDFHAVY
jgi:hypothetical protein